jgi:hypothetical protein
MTKPEVPHTSKPTTQHQHGDPVTIEINGDDRTVPDGVYKITEIKALLGVPSEYVLNLVEEGRFQELPDERSLHIKGGEKFVSQPPQGGSS